MLLTSIVPLNKEIAFFCFCYSVFQTALPKERKQCSIQTVAFLPDASAQAFQRHPTSACLPHENYSVWNFRLYKRQAKERLYSQLKPLKHHSGVNNLAQSASWETSFNISQVLVLAPPTPPNQKNNILNRKNYPRYQLVNYWFPEPTSEK